MAHLLWTKPRRVTASLEETIDLSSDLLNEDLVLTLLAECEHCADDERLDTIRAICDLLLILGPKQCDKFLHQLRRVHEATPKCIRNGMDLE